MDYLLGEEMRKIILLKGMTFKTFADRLGISDRNLQNFIKRNDFLTEQLKRASKILEHKFIDYYLANPTGGKKLLNVEVDEKPKDYISMSFTVTIAGFSSTLRNFRNY
jgi:transcriptional regulator with XRE-family HTH domain